MLNSFSRIIGLIAFFCLVCFGAPLSPAHAMTAVPTPTRTPNPNKPTVITLNSPSETEGGGLTFVVQLSQPNRSQVNIRYNTSQGTAKAGTDYEAVGNGEISLQPGETVAYVSVRTINDEIPEDDETMKVVIRSATGENVTIGGGGTATIIDDDRTPPSIFMYDTSVREGNSGDASLIFHLALSRAIRHPVTVLVNTSQGTAKAGADYEPVGRATITFPPGTTGATFTVKVRGDTIAEGRETLRLVLRSPTNATLEVSSAEGLIVDDDGPVPKASPPGKGSAPSA